MLLENQEDLEKFHYLKDLIKYSQNLERVDSQCISC